MAASICAYYSKRKTLEVVIKTATQEEIKIYSAITEEEILKYRL